MNHISHHGILGQKWGKKNGPPYPLYRSKLGAKEKLNADTLSKYKSQYSNLNHVKVSPNSKGYIYSKNGKVTAIINTEKKPDGHTWIQGLEVFGDSKGQGLSPHILDTAVNSLHADRLSVRNTNSIAKNLYKNHGWVEYDNDGFMSYMKYDPNVAKAQDRVRNTAKTKKDVDTIVNSLSSRDKKRLGVNKNGEYLSLEEGENVMKRILLKEGDTPVAFLDVFDEGINDKGKTDVSVALAVAGNKHGKGYGGEVAKKGSDWVDKHLDEFGMVWWTTAPDNIASQKLAEKNGWKYSDKDSNKDWKIYRKQ